MSSINDYIKWRGDLKLSSEHKFNELDSLILARFSYLIFHKIEMNKVETIESISKKMAHFKNNEFLFNGDKEMITLLGKSRRFKDLKVTDYVRNNSKKEEQQFSALVIHISKKSLYISFVGTDENIYGWKEDFNMAFMDEVPCQKLGTSYLNQIAQKYWYKKIRIGGHSKEGNIALYSALTANKSIQKINNLEKISRDKDAEIKELKSQILSLKSDMNNSKKLANYELLNSKITDLEIKNRELNSKIFTIIQSAKDKIESNQKSYIQELENQKKYYEEMIKNIKTQEINRDSNG